MGVNARVFGLLSLGCLALYPLAARASADPNLPQPEAKDVATRLEDASVLMVDKNCTGAIVEAQDLVLTAAHCIPARASTTRVRVSGLTLRGRVEHLDRDSDLALVRLPQDSGIEPLTVAPNPPRRGQQLTFWGRPDRARLSRTTRVQSIGRCPSLPRVGAAAFTSLRALPGDSGAPLVDALGRVVAIVHGGARCHIAVPVHSLNRGPLLQPSSPRDQARTKALPRPTLPRAMPTHRPSAPKTARSASSSFGRSFNFRFNWSFDSRRDPDDRVRFEFHSEKSKP